MLRINLLGLVALACGACSTYPLQEQVTHLSTRTIVDKIRCEARRAVVDHLVEPEIRFGMERVAFETRKSIYDLNPAELADVLKKLDAKRPEKDKFAGRAKRAAVRELCHRKVLQSTPTQTALDKCNDINSEEFKSVTEQQMLKDAAYRAAAKTSEMDLLKKEYLFAAVGFDFRFTITEGENATGNAVFTMPFTNGVFTLGLGVGEDKQRKGERNFAVVEYFGELIHDANLDQCSQTENWKYPVSGRVGVDEVVRTYADLNGLGSGFGRRPPGGSSRGGDRTEDRTGGDTPRTRGSDDSANAADITDVLTFTTTINGSVNPQVRLDPISDRFRLTSASALFGPQRKDEHKLTISLSSVFTDSRVSTLGNGEFYGIVRLANNPFDTDSGTLVDPKERVFLNLQRERSLGILRDRGVID